MSRAGECGDPPDETGSCAGTKETSPSEKTHRVAVTDGNTSLGHARWRGLSDMIRLIRQAEAR
jgi:hypothetical protein